MDICGLQKMTLLDYPGNVACTVFLGGCDFRCPFCHNYDLACGSLPPVTDEDGFFTFLSRRKGLLDGVAVSGGEPCIHRELPGFLGKIREAGFRIKLDTNGGNPDMLEYILSEGLADFVSMDIKNSPEKYAATCGLPEVDMSRIRRSIALLKEGRTGYEFRTTVIREFHEKRDFEVIGQMIEGADAYFLQPFVDRDGVPWRGLHTPSESELREYAAAAARYVPETALRGVDQRP